MALRLHEDLTCPGCGQVLSESMNPALADYWTTMDPVRCHACTALAVAQDVSQEARHPHALRHVVGLREGWEEALTTTPDQ